MVGNDTIRFYADNAAVYAAHTSEPSRRLAPFLERMRPGAEILELGCGNGRDSAAMMARGFRVVPTDGTAEMAAEASRRLGIPVRVLRFADLDMTAAFDGVWANACLLHVPREELGDVVSRIFTALRSGGTFYASYKAGEAEGIDGLRRYYNYPSRPWLQRAYEALPWATLDIGEGKGAGYDNQPADWLHVTAVKG